MPYPAVHQLLTFGGQLGEAEQWSNSLRFTTAGTPSDQAGEMATLARIQTVFNNAWTGNATPISADAKLSWFKWNRIGVDGFYANSYTNVIDQGPQGTQGQAIHPFQIALVVTLRTQQLRGLAKSGRIYSPSPSYQAAPPNRTLAVGSAQAAATWWAGILSNLNETQGVGTAAVFSKVREGASHVITSVDVGTVFDTMRSRRNQLVEQRSSAPVDADPN